MRWIMLDRILELSPGQSARGLKAVTASEDYFEHHMVRFPVVPGALVLDMIAQLAGRLAAYTYEKKTGDPVVAFPTGVEDVRYHRFVKPGEVIELHASLLSLDGGGALIDAEARCRDGPVCTCRYEFILEPVQDPAAIELIRWDMSQLWDEYDLA